MPATARPPAWGQAAARRCHRLRRCRDGVEAAGFPLREEMAKLRNAHPAPFSPLQTSLSPRSQMSVPAPVLLCSLDGVSARITSPHPGTPPTLLQSYSAEAQQPGAARGPPGPMASRCGRLPAGLPTPSALIQRLGLDGVTR
jgi:hypothetical protein